MFDQDVTAVRVAATSRQGFFRCGRGFTYEGEIVGVDEFAEDQWEVILSEPNLRVTPTDEVPETEAQARFDLIWGTIQTLPAEAFQKDGKPRLEDLNDLLASDIDGRINARERDAIWDQMTKGGFEAPEQDD